MIGIVAIIATLITVTGCNGNGKSSGTTKNRPFVAYQVVKSETRFMHFDNFLAPKHVIISEWESQGSPKFTLYACDYDKGNNKVALTTMGMSSTSNELVLSSCSCDATEATPNTNLETAKIKQIPLKK